MPEAMTYTLRVHYRSGFDVVVGENLLRHQLWAALTERLIANQEEQSVEKWEIFPE